MIGKRIFIIAVLALTALSGCGKQQALLAKYSPGSRAWIDAPLPGTSQPLGPVEIVAHASSPSGIASFEISLNGQPLATASPDADSFDPNLMFMRHSWRPAAPGTYLIEVRAMDASNQAGPAAQVMVVISPKETITPLTCSTPQEPIEAGSAVNISGKLTSSTGGEEITIEYTSPSGESSIQNVTVNAEGSFEDKFVTEEVGKWMVQIFWKGSDQSVPSQSEPCYFEVKSGKPEFTLNHDINCRSGPGTEYPVITSGRIGDVIEIEARSPDALWLYGIMNGSRCWMSLELGELNVNPWTLLERQPPPKPIKPTKTPSICSAYTTESVCLRYKKICKWVVQPTGAGVCVPK